MHPWRLQGLHLLQLRLGLCGLQSRLVLQVLVLGWRLMLKLLSQQL